MWLSGVKLIPNALHSFDEIVMHSGRRKFKKFNTWWRSQLLQRNWANALHVNELAWSQVYREQIRNQSTLAHVLDDSSRRPEYALHQGQEACIPWYSSEDPFLRKREMKTRAQPRHSRRWHYRVIVRLAGVVRVNKRQLCQRLSRRVRRTLIGKSLTSHRHPDQTCNVAMIGVIWHIFYVTLIVVIRISSELRDDAFHSTVQLRFHLSIVQNLTVLLHPSLVLPDYSWLQRSWRITPETYRALKIVIIYIWSCQMRWDNK
jgi:hypothetical protein